MVDRAPVSRARSAAREPGPRGLFALALLLSLLAHLGFFVFVGRTFTLPPLDIALQIPIDVELGMTEEVAGTPPPEPPAVEAPPEQRAAPKKPKRAPVVDGGLADAASEEDAEAGAGLEAGAEQAGPADSGLREPLVLGDAGPPGARLPPGAQIALRVDMARIRRSPLAEDVRALLGSIRDWRALLDGSGIDPVAQLERLLIMTPNLEREKVALAGRFNGGREVVDGAVRSLAEARGVEAVWRKTRGIPVAPWANADSTPRVIALVGPAHFTISREEDLARILAIAAARAQKGAGKSGPNQPSMADALLAMEENEGLSLDVEGVERFVRRGGRGIPLKLRISAIQQGETALFVRGLLSYADEAAARDALDYWQRARERYARNALVALLGLSGVLNEAALSQEGDLLHITLTLSVEQTRLVLGYLRELLAPAR
jgi:hypothetical protein